MKQHISVKQLNELSEKGKSKIFQWYWKHSQEQFAIENPKALATLGPTLSPLLSIGQMIEFLGWEDMEIYMAKPPTRYMKKHHPEKAIQEWIVQDGDYENAGISFKGNSICDALWQAVKEVLEK